MHKSFLIIKLYNLEVFFF